MVARDALDVSGRRTLGKEFVLARASTNRADVRSAALREFSKAELRALRALKSPVGIQAFLDRIPYHIGTTAWSPRVVLREGTAHCLEGALFAAAALRANGYRPLIVDLEADNDTDHVIAVYQQHGGWGAVASSNYATCRYRSPIYRSLRELALSYFEGYFNLRRQRTLRRFSRPVDLARFDDQHWMTTEQPLWFVVDHLFEIGHTELLTPKMKKNLARVDERSFRAGLYGHRKKEPEPAPASSAPRRRRR